MSDDDPFADLGETLSDDPESPPGDGAADGEAGDAEPTDRREPETDAAFAYEAAVQRPFYAREETVEDFDAWLNYELERELSDRGYRNVAVREMTDALLRTVAEEDLIPAVAERFEAAREDAIRK